MFPVGDDAGGRVEEGLAPQECGQRFAGVGDAAMQVAVSARQQPEAPGDGMAVGGDQAGHGMVGIEHAVLGQRLYGLEAAAHGIALGTRERQKMLDGIAPGADTQPAYPAPESMAVRAQSLCGRDALDDDLSFQVTRLGKVKGHLHAKPCFGGRTESL